MEDRGLETLELVPHHSNPPLRVAAITARVIALDALWCVLRWRVEGARDLVVPGFAGARRQDGLWQTTCFELFVRQALPRTGEGWVGVPEVDGVHKVDGPGHPSPTPPLRGGAYCEFNFSPSERWAAYDFTAYRTGMAERPLARAPVITPRRGSDVLIMDVALAVPDLPPLPWHYGLTAVIEEAGGVKSYWAMAHPGERPDFHDPACHAARLAAPGGA